MLLNFWVSRERHFLWLQSPMADGWFSNSTSERFILRRKKPTEREKKILFAFVSNLWRNFQSVTLLFELWNFFWLGYKMNFCLNATYVSLPTCCQESTYLSQSEPLLHVVTRCSMVMILFFWIVVWNKNFLSLKCFNFVTTIMIASFDQVTRGKRIRCDWSIKYFGIWRTILWFVKTSHVDISILSKMSMTCRHPVALTENFELVTWGKCYSLAFSC